VPTLRDRPHPITGLCPVKRCESISSRCRHRVPRPGCLRFPASYVPVRRVPSLSRLAHTTAKGWSPACRVGHQWSVREKPVKRKVPGVPLVETISAP
jgi:hypothetical protein